MNVNRPKPAEDVEDLEREQEKFLTSQSRASATLQKRPLRGSGDGSDIGNAGPCRKSRFRRERDEERGQVSPAGPTLPETPLLRDLVERPGTAIYVPEAPGVESTRDSFPKPTRRDVAPLAPPKCAADSKASLFMQGLGSFASMNVEQGLQTREEIDMEYESIEKENQEKLSKMTPEDIAEAQRELLARLDPKLVQFLREKQARPRTNVTKIIKGGSQLDVATLSNLMMPNPAPADLPSTAEFRESELPLEPSAMAQYPGMERIEKDKLAWMTLLPPLPGTIVADKGADGAKRRRNEDQSEAVFICRFDFQGCILAVNLDVPTQRALHHHGEEPERAGYTIRELITLLASAVPSQRIVALQVLANILNNHHSGKYDRCFPSGPDLLESLLACGLVSLLRVSLDDQSASQVSEALKTTFLLLVSPHDEACLDLVHSWVDEEPYMRPALEIFGPKESSDEELRALSDEQLVSCDIVRGLLRMGILARIRYLLEVCQPDTGAVGAALGSLIRIARHSPEAAERVANCPRLCKFIVTEYLPLFGWNKPRLLHGKLASSGGVPLAQALKLIRVLCASSNQTAASLLVGHSLDRTIGIYLNIDVNEPKLPRREVLQLQLESLRLLRVLLRHGLCGDFFDDISPVILRQLNFAQHVSLRPRTGDPQLFDLDYAACLMACSHARLKQIVSRDDGEWRAIASHIQATVAVVVRWLNELVEESSTRITAMSSLAVAVRFLADAHFHRPSEVDLSSVLTALRRLAESPRWATLCELMISSTVLGREHRASHGSKRDVAALPSLGAIRFGTETVTPTVHERSPVFLVDSVVYLVWSAVQSRALEGVGELGWHLLSAGPLATYLAYVNSPPFEDTSACPWFARTEVSLLYRIVRLQVALETSADLRDEASKGRLDFEVFRNTALTIIPLLSPDRSASINHLLKQIIFNQTFYSEIPTLGVANLSMDQRTPISASGKQGHGDTELMHRALDEMDEILQTAEDTIYFVRSTIDSRFMEPHPSKSSQCEYLFTTGLLPSDWMYLPLRLLYSEAMQAKTRKPDSKSSEDTGHASPDALHTPWLRRSLQAALLLAAHSNVMTNRLPPQVNFVRLASVFVVDCESFLDRELNSMLATLFTRLIVPHSTRCEFDSVNFRWKGLPAFTDFYASLVEQFEACSYGDSVFSAYLLLPQQRCYHADLRQLLFTEHAPLLRCVSLPEGDIFGLPAKRFLEPKETDENLLLAYRSALNSQTVIEKRNPFLFMMLKHHTSP